MHFTPNSMKKWFNMNRKKKVKKKIGEFVYVNPNDGRKSNLRQFYPNREQSCNVDADCWERIDWLAWQKLS